MLIILASRDDLAARWLADEWAADDAVVMTCEDLSSAGWELYVGDVDRDAVSIGGRRASSRDVQGVLTLLPSVTPYELPAIVEEDREYVAQEMMAFLLAWLDALGPRAMNRPTPFCLMGPHWRRERWVAAARELGLQTAPTSATTVSLSAVTVVVDRAFSQDGTAAPAARQVAAVQLASAAGADLLTVHFTADDEVANAGLWPDIRTAAVRSAVRDRLLRAAA